MCVHMHMYLSHCLVMRLGMCSNLGMSMYHACICVNGVPVSTRDLLSRYERVMKANTKDHHHAREQGEGKRS